MDKKVLDKMVRGLAKEMRDLGYPVKPIHNVKLSKASTCFGKCTIYCYGYVDITITELGLLGSKEDLKNTIIHELCHACCDIGDHHGDNWKYYARKASKDFHTNITITSEVVGKEQKSYLKSKIKYRIQCDNCGAIDEYQRKTKFVQSVINNRHLYRCHCGCISFHLI